MDLSGGDSSATPTRCTDGVDSLSTIGTAMESDLATRGATLNQSEMNIQGGNSVVAILTKTLDSMTESDSKLRHILDTFFPLFSSMSKNNQLAIEAAFIPTMKVSKSIICMSMCSVLICRFCLMPLSLLPWPR